MTATKTKAKAKEAAGYVNPLGLPGKPERATVPVKELFYHTSLQVRKDVDAGSTVDESRAEQFAEAMKALVAAGLPASSFEPKEDKESGLRPFPAIKVMRIPEGKPEDGKTRLVVWDGNHTTRGAEIAKVKELECLIWEGTGQQAIMAAATVANREHERNGKPLSNKDKQHGVQMAATAFLKSDIPKKEWPTNRQLAELVGVSHTFVNSLDPFKRKAPDSKTREQELEDKKKKRQQPDLEPDEEPGEDDAEADGPEAEGNGSEIQLAAVFDWQRQEQSLGFVIRSIESMFNTFDMNRHDPAGYKLAVDAADTLAKLIRKWRQELKAPRSVAAAA